MVDGDKNAIWKRKGEPEFMVMWWQRDEPQVGPTSPYLPELLAALKGSATCALPVAGLPLSSP